VRRCKIDNTLNDIMTLYLSCNWWSPKGDIETQITTAMKKANVSMFDWSQFYDLTCEDNAAAAVTAIRNCQVYAAVLTDPKHAYSGTLELMSMALALGKPVVILNTMPENHGIKNNKQHNWMTVCDRYLLYHPEVIMCKDPEQFTNELLHLMEIFELFTKGKLKREAVK
jgi:hypothetical protein